MVKISLRGMSVECLFREDISIVGILGGKSDIVFLGDNSEFGGQGEFLNVLVVEQDSLFYPVNVRVVLCQPGHSQDYLGLSKANDHEG